MGRTREFDADAALAAAMRTFWERGYDGTSLTDLTSATGVGRQSLYLAFGDKQRLYLAALDRYREHFFVPLVEALDASTDVRTALREAILRVSAAFAGLETALLEAAQRGRAAGLVSDDVDLGGWAAMTVATIQGLRVMAAGGTDRKTLVRALDATLAQLRS
ncbi:TetR/AcrR family transcriptional regulator [Asanoa siamensis]|uniref:TetR family transcriptional regulator n=1 Tax=Asanoa siamensis TaxID=926357 RepID=A0ABQ4CY87_9ACTN|nr:TetR/AcrR family transcriptional regulator [Asanoa siamensis]GIF76262.1 TetR family transcriptional regulator [Asanoa siamensis]